MKTKEKIKDYLSTHWFKSRHHSYYIRGFLMTEFPDDKDFEFKMVLPDKEGNNYVTEDTITATDAIKFIEDEI